MGCLVWSVFGSALLPEPTQPAVSPHRPPIPVCWAGPGPRGAAAPARGFCLGGCRGKTEHTGKHSLCVLYITLLTSDLR